MTKQSARDVIARIRRVVEENLDGALDDIQEGLQVKLGNARYERGTIYPITFKFEVSATNDEGIVETPEASSFKRNAVRYGLSPDDLGKTFKTWRGEEYTITGLNTRRRKYPISAVDKNGKSWKFPADQVKDALSRAA